MDLSTLLGFLVVILGLRILLHQDKTFDPLWIIIRYPLYILLGAFAVSLLA